MKQQITALFTESKKERIFFNPAIRIKPAAWIDMIFKVRDQIIVTISNRKDSMNKNLNTLNDSQLNSLLERMQSDKSFKNKK